MNPHTEVRFRQAGDSQCVSPSLYAAALSSITSDVHQFELWNTGRGTVIALWVDTIVKCYCLGNHRILGGDSHQIGNKAGRGRVAFHTWHISNYLIILPIVLFGAPAGKITFNQVTAHILKGLLKESGMKKGVCSDGIDALKSLTSGPQ